MQKVRNTEGSTEVVEEAEAVAAQSPEVETGEELKLSMREALEVSLDEVKAKEESSNDSEISVREHTRAKRKASNETNLAADDNASTSRLSGAVTDDSRETSGSQLQPPAEWSKEEKEDFLSSTPKAQEAALRLHKARQGKLEEIKRESGELQWVKDLVKDLDPFVKTRGGKEPTHAQIAKAIDVVNRLGNANNIGDIVEVMRARNLPVPEILEQALNSAAEKTPDLQINAVLQRVAVLESMLSEGAKAQTNLVLAEQWNSFQNEQNAAGVAKYPDLANPETGLRLARNIGSLVGADGPTPLSEQFIASVKDRIPGATYQTLLQEAYRYLGGQVADSKEPPKTQTTQTHIVRSRRAASSVPGRSAGALSSGNVKRFPTRQAYAEAIAELNARDGE